MSERGRMDDNERLEHLLRDYAEAVGSLAACLPSAFERQWDPARVRAADGPTHADPTGETAVDPRRLALRARVIAAERSVEEATAKVQEVEAHLRHALDAWVGEA